MTLHEFTVHLDRPLSSDDLDRLYTAGLDDTVPEITAGSAVLHVARRCDSLVQAILTVVADIERAGFQATGIDSEDLVTLADIGEKTNRTRESVRLLAGGKRGPGGFPAPITDAGSRSLYSWAAVREWFRTHYGPDSAAPADRAADTLAAADLLLRARLLTTDITELSQLVA
ncbi:MAG: hypothetical protein LBI33_14040 [Propionibacteriaceae bacterium]|jgi:hypothetical protein|nr:hypothetical protein [Propionibacteriaceae bacterium]